MDVIVFGATGGTGRATVRALTARGHRVTAFVRTVSMAGDLGTARVVQGDVMQADAVEAAVPGHDVAIVALGNPQNPFARLLGARRTTPADVCTVGTQHVAAALERAGIGRMVVVSAFGIGNPSVLPIAFKLFYRLVLREQMADKATQQVVVETSGLDWTIVQPVGLTDGPATGRWFADKDWKIRTQQIARADVAGFLVTLVEGSAYRRATVALSGDDLRDLVSPERQNRRSSLIQ